MNVYVVTAVKARDYNLRHSYRLTGQRPLFKRAIEADNILEALINVYERWGEKEAITSTESRTAPKEFAVLYGEGQWFFISPKED